MQTVVTNVHGVYPSVTWSFGAAFAKSLWPFVCCLDAVMKCVNAGLFSGIQ